MKDKICSENKLLERLNTIKFQGKPPKIKLLKNSITPKKREKINIDENLFLRSKKLQK